MLALICVIIKAAISCMAVQTISYSGPLEAIALGAFIYSLLSLYIWVFKTFGIVFCCGSFIELVFSLCVWVLIPFFLICGLEWLLSFILPEAILPGAVNAIAIMILVGFIVRDVFRVLVGFGVLKASEEVCGCDCQKEHVCQEWPVEAPVQKKLCAPKDYNESAAQPWKQNCSLER